MDKMSLRQLPEIKAFDPAHFRYFDPEDFEGPEDDLVMALAPENNEISIYGTIGSDPFSSVDNTERRISAALRAIGPKEVRININSNGGNYLNGLSIYNLLREHKAKVSVNVLAMAGSAASIIAMAGDEINMASGSQMFLHNASVVAMFNKFDGPVITQLLSDVDAAMAEIYAVRAGVENSQAAAWMDKDRGGGTYFSADAAIKAGLADGKTQASMAKLKAEENSVPVERLLERALMAGNRLTRGESRSLITAYKRGKRDAATHGMPDAAALTAAIERCRSTLRA
jgi:ATP-dependent Clp protease, protease subunit